MKDARFTLHKVKVHLKSFKDPLIIKPFGDVHRFHDHCDKEGWFKWLKECRAGDGYNVRYIGLGDDDDKLSKRERTAFVAAMQKMHDGTRSNIDSLVKGQLYSYCKELSFMGDRLIGMCAGNHFWEFEDGTSSTDYYCRRLDTKNLGFLTYIVIQIEIGSGKTKCHTHLDIVACHGKAGGKLVGTSINQVNDLRNVFPNADIYLMGHDHQRGCWPSEYLEVGCLRTGKPHLRKKPVYLGRTGSFLLGYVPDASSYVVSKTYRPANLGTIEFQVKFSREYAEGYEGKTKAGRAKGKGPMQLKRRIKGIA